MGVPELADDERYATHAARGAHADELDDMVSAWSRGRPAAAALDALREGAVPAGRVYTAADMLTDPHFHARDMIPRLTTTSGRQIPSIGVVPKFSRTPGVISRSGPPLGADTAAVRAEVNPPPPR
jgi:crotonobetainyl-CoA:carnitine CoA-transferase CaiB-like acyl-CoA transferase